MTFLIFSCKKTHANNDPIPKHDTSKIDSKVVNETRVINVWLPPIYQSTNDSLPVIYMPDGGIREDFHTLQIL